MKPFKLASIACLAAATAAVYAQSGQATIRVFVFGSEVQFSDQQPVMSDGRVLVPLRGVFERMGARVGWDPSTQTVSAVRGRTHIKLGIGQLDASVNDRDVHLDVPATLVGGSTMVPLRFVSEALGAEVKWNEFQHEVDVLRGDNFDPGPPPPPRVIVRTEVIHDRPVAPPAPAITVIPADSVLPFRLNNRLNSYDARPDDPFTATLETNGQNRFGDLPNGTLVYGHVSYVRARHGDDPGLIELRFDHLTTPAGRSLPINGRLIGLDSDSVSRGDHGVLVAKDSVRNDRSFFSGYGPGVGLIVGIHDSHAIADIRIGDFMRRTVSKDVQRRQANDVQLVPGTRFGIRLHQDLAFPRGTN